MLIKTVVLATALLAIARVTVAQEPHHGPTAAVCRADIAIWYNATSAADYYKTQTAFMNDGVPNRHPYAKLSITEVSARILEMNECAQTDSESAADYHAASNGEERSLLC
jgi:hypothetical protein